MEIEFYQCSHCGQIVAIVKKTGVPLICCGEKMQKLIPSSTDASVEKHVPVITVDGNKVTVTVGSVEHPMIEQHYIEWIVLQTKNGNQRQMLSPGQSPKAVFAILDEDEVLGAYAYCNLHGLWKN